MLLSEWYDTHAPELRRIYGEHRPLVIYQMAEGLISYLIGNTHENEFAFYEKHQSFFDTLNVRKIMLVVL